MDFLSLFQKKIKNPMREGRLGFIYCIQNKGSHCNPRKGVEGDAPLPGDFRVIVCLTPPQVNDFCDLLGTLDAPVSKIASVKKIGNLLYKNNIFVRSRLLQQVIEIISFLETI